jgi:pentatricopeptide repeat protein
MRLSRRNRYGAVPPSNVTYTHAIASCRKAPQADLDTARFFLRSALDDGVEPNVFMYSATIWTAEKKGDSNAALQLLEQMKSSNCTPNVVSYNGVISSFAKAGNFKEAVALFLEMKKCNIRSTPITYVVRRLCSKSS